MTVISKVVLLGRKRVHTLLGGLVHVHVLTRGSGQAGESPFLKSQVLCLTPSSQAERDALFPRAAGSWPLSCLYPGAC